MFRSRKILCMLVVLVLAFSFSFVGCGTVTDLNSETKASADTASTADQQTKPEELPPVELSVYLSFDPIQKDTEMVLGEVNKYLKEKINATLKNTIMTTEDYQAKVPVMLAAGQEMDAVFAPTWGPVHIYNNIAKGAFVPMNELLEKHGKEVKQAIPQLLWDANTVKGNIYAVPIYKEVGHQFGFFLNKDLVTKYGIDVGAIKKFADIEPALKIIKEQATGVMPYTGGSMYHMALPLEHVTGDWALPGVLNVTGAESFARTDDKVFNQYETPEFMAFCQTVYKWNKLGYIPENPGEYVTKCGPDEKAGKLFASALWYAPNYEATFGAAVGHEVIWAPCYAPLAETGDIGGGFAICKTSANPERTMMYLNLLYTDKKLGTMLRHGIEGTHYTKIDDNTLDMTGTGLDLKNHSYNCGMGWQFGSIFNSMLDKSVPANTFDAFLNYNKNAKGTAGLGFVFDQTPVAAEIAALQNVIKQYFDPLANGMVDPEVYMPKFINELKANNVDKLLAEVQKQFDAWKAATGK